MSDPTIVNDQENYQKVAKQHRDLEPTVEKFREYRKIKHGIAEAQGHARRDRPRDARDGAGRADALEPRLPNRSKKS